MPRWLVRGLLDQFARRSVRSSCRGHLGAPRMLLRGIGMGGTSSTLIWNMGYDPIFTFVEQSTGVLVPSYMDDGEVLSHGPYQTVAASVALLAA